VESGDDVVLTRIKKGATAQDHIEAGQMARTAGLEINAYVMLGIGGQERSETHARETARVINAMQPYSCIRCSKPFGTLKAIEAMLGKLAGHAMFQGAAADRLKMCADCRVIDIYSSDNEVRIDQIR
jgi:hypothetical protein